MRAWKMLSPSLLAVAALTACGGEVPDENTAEPRDRHLLEPAEQDNTGIGTKPDRYVDSCADADGVQWGDLGIRQDGDLSRLDGVARVEGDVVVTNVSSLGDFACVREIMGNLVIRGTTTLKDLSGLGQLNVVAGGIWITENTQLSSVADLKNLKHVAADIFIERNTALRDLDGLANVGGALRGGLYIRDNDALERVTGFTNLDGIAGDVVIAGNPALESVTGFVGADGVVAVHGDVVLEDNDALGRAELPMMEFGPAQGSLLVRNNAHLKELTLHADHRLRIAGDVVFRENPELRTLVGFTNIQHVMGDLRIEDNDAFSTLEGLRSLQGVNGDLVVLGNDGISNLDLTGLESVGGDLMVGRNTALADTNGLVSLLEVFGALDFFDNAMLPTCAVEELDARLLTGRFEAMCER